jgi:hypothetical protein
LLFFFPAAFAFPLAFFSPGGLTIGSMEYSMESSSGWFEPLQTCT